MSADAAADLRYKQHLDKLRNSGKLVSKPQVETNANTPNVLDQSSCTRAEISGTGSSYSANDRAWEAKTELKSKLAGVLGKIESKYKTLPGHKMRAMSATKPVQSVKAQGSNSGIQPSLNTTGQNEKLSTDQAGIVGHSALSPKPKVVDEATQSRLKESKIDLMQGIVTNAENIKSTALSEASGETATSPAEASNASVKSSLTSVIAQIEIASVIGKIESKYKGIPNAQPLINAVSIPNPGQMATHSSCAAEPYFAGSRSHTCAFENKLASVIGKIESKHNPGPKFAVNPATSTTQLGLPSRPKPGVLSSTNAGTVMSNHAGEDLKRKLANVLGKIEIKHKGETESSPAFSQTESPGVNSRTELQSKLAGILGQIESKHCKQALPAKRQVNAELSAAYLEHLAKLRGKTMGKHTPTNEQATHPNPQQLETADQSSGVYSEASVKQSGVTPAGVCRNAAGARTTRSVIVKEETMSPFLMQSQIPRLEVCISSASEGALNVSRFPTEVLNARDEGSPNTQRLPATELDGSNLAAPSRSDEIRLQSHYPHLSYCDMSGRDAKGELILSNSSYTEEQLGGPLTNCSLRKSAGIGTLPEQSQTIPERSALRGILKRSHDGSGVSETIPNGSKNGATALKTLRRDLDFGEVKHKAIKFMSSLLPDGSADVDISEEMAEGLEFLRPVSGYHCMLCNTFYQDYPTALHHCTRSAHKAMSRLKKEVKK